MMPTIIDNLQIDAAAVGSASISSIYLGTNQVFGGAVAPTEYSIFGSASPAEPTSNNDADPSSWLGQQFYVPQASTLQLAVLGLRIYVPAGSSFIGKVGQISLMRRAQAAGGIFMSDGPEGKDPGTTDAVTSFSSPLVAGWNDRLLSTEWPMLPGDGIIVGYSVDNGTYYLYDSTTPVEAIQDQAGKGFYLAEAANNTPGSAGRCVYRGAWTTARWYGIDILVREEA